jgi:hypothetical protein
MKKRDHVLPVGHAAVAAGHGHAAEADGRNLEPLEPSLRCCINGSPSGWFDLPTTLFARRPNGQL